MCRVPWAYLRWSYRLWREEESPQLGLLQLSKGRFDGLLGEAFSAGQPYLPKRSCVHEGSRARHVFERHWLRYRSCGSLREDAFFRSQQLRWFES